MASFAQVKKTVVSVVDDFTELDITANYAPKGAATYSAKTKLIKIGINAPVLAIMPPRFNKSLRAVCGPAWSPVGSIDLVQQATIGDLILLACGQSGTKVPVGEPT